MAQAGLTVGLCKPDGECLALAQTKVWVTDCLADMLTLHEWPVATMTSCHVGQVRLTSSLTMMPANFLSPGHRRNQGHSNRQRPGFGSGQHGTPRPVSCIRPHMFGSPSSVCWSGAARVRRVGFRQGSAIDPGLRRRALCAASMLRWNVRLLLPNCDGQTDGQADVHDSGLRPQEQGPAQHVRVCVCGPGRGRDPPQAIPR